MKTRKGDLAEKAMLVHLQISKWTGRTKDAKVTDEVIMAKNSDRDSGAWWTYLIPKKSLKTINYASDRCRFQHGRLTLPWMDGGLRILPSSMFIKYSQVMRKVIAEYEEAVNDFLEEYPTIIAESKKRLGKLIEGKKLPSTEEIRYRFAIQTDVLPIPSANDFRVNLNKDEVEDIRKQISNSIETMTQKAMTEVWEQLATLIEKVRKTLKQSDKKFKDSLINNLKDFCELIPKLNLIDDNNLESIRKLTIKRLTNLSPDNLRSNKRERKDAHKAAKEVLEKMNTFMKGKKS